ncbi:MAG: ankyrin repeat domain-containing protein [Planctomycetes bacterium]|nr:ankyrin repeat domain-containing protein [Planctomycetota bacterium]
MNVRQTLAVVVGLLAGNALLAQDELSAILVRDDGPALVALLQKQPAVRDTKIEGGWPPLNVAAARGSLACVRELLAAKAAVDSTDAQGRTPAQRAAEAGHRAVAQLLCQHGARVDLDVAMVAGDEAWVRRWLGENAGEVPWTTQVAAAKAGATATLRVALPRAAARPDNPIGPQQPGLAFFALAHADTLTMVLDHGEAMDEPLQGNWGLGGSSSLLHSAASIDAGASLDVLLNRGFPVDEPDEHGNTALVAACHAAAPQAIATLLGKGASLARGPELLRMVCECLARGTNAVQRQRRHRAAGLLLAHGVPLDAFAAVTLGRHRELAALVAAEPKLASEATSEPLLVRAALCTDREALRILLDAGAPVGVTGRDGYTPLHWAVFWDAPDCVELLLERGAEVSPAAANGLTPLHEAVRCSHPEQAGRLLRAGADRTKKDQQGKLPLDYAAPELRAKFEAVFAAAR